MIEYYQKVADLWPRYGEIDSTIVHLAIVVSLINLEMTSVCLGTYPPEKGYPCWQAMKQIQASPAFERLREKEEGVANLLDLYVARYETDAFAVAVTPKKPFDPALREELIAMTERAYAEKVHPDHWTADMYQVLISQIGCAFERGQMPHYECWKIIHDFYMQTHATMNQEEIDVISYYVTCLDSMLLFLDEADMPREEKRLHFREYQHEIQSFITDYNKRSCVIPPR